MKTKKLFYAVSARGQGVVFIEKPERVEKIGVWAGKIEGCYCSVIADMAAEGLLRLPLMTYSDEPIELKLTVSYG
jgi:hypothetical protein